MRPIQEKGQSEKSNEIPTIGTILDALIKNLDTWEWHDEIADGRTFNVWVENGRIHLIVWSEEDEKGNVEKLMEREFHFYMELIKAKDSIQA